MQPIRKIISIAIEIEYKMEINATEYKLRSCLTEREFEDSGWMLADPQDKEPALIRAIYKKRQIEFKEPSYGIYRFADWLPVRRMLKNSSAPITYKSEKLAKELRLENLYITFSGYWPERGVFMQTCSFKETEAYSVCARLPQDSGKILVVASAGNTARAFAQVCSDNNIPIVIAIPEDNLPALWFKEPLGSCVKIICSPKGSDYFDAIALAAKLSADSRFLEEGGAKNVARRDGMGTTVLSATEAIGRIPDAYFQAVGSGTGAIAAYEANLRLIEDGRFGNHLMRLMPSQNYPFIPMYQAWEKRSRALLPSDDALQRELALKIKAAVLSNRRPPYSIHGGLYDALTATNGHFYHISNSELDEGLALFKQCEGIDIHPAAAVALVSLQKAVAAKDIAAEDTIMLNITGGGEELFKSRYNFVYAKPDLILSPEKATEEVIKRVSELF